MNDDFKKLQAAWTQSSRPDEEVAVSRRLWKRALWRTRFWNVVEGAVLLVLAVYLATWVSGDASWRSAVLSAVIVSLLWFSQRKRYLLRGAELGAPDPGRVTFLRGEMIRVRARLIRSGFSLALVIPLFGLGVLVGQLRRGIETGPAAIAPDVPVWLQSPTGKTLIVVLLLLVLAKLAHAFARDRRTHARLSLLIDEYRAENRLDQSESGNAT